MMNKPNVLILCPDAEDYLPFLEGLTTEGVSLQAVGSVEEAKTAYAGQTVVLGRPDLLASVLPRWPQVRWVQSSWAGVTPLLNCGRENFLLTGIKDTFGTEMAEYVMTYLLMHELKVLERLGRQANKSWWSEYSGSLVGKTLAVMGTGSIGACIARQAETFGMRCIGLNREGSAVNGFDATYSSSRLHEFLSLADYVVGVLPDTPDTRGLLDREAFQAMNSHAYLVNVGRGSLVNESHLVEALIGGQLAGGALDVFQEEPLPDDSPLWHAPGLIITAHVSGISKTPEIARIFEQNYRLYSNGEPLNYRIDFQRGY